MIQSFGPNRSLRSHAAGLNFGQNGPKTYLSELVEVGDELGPVAVDEAAEGQAILPTGIRKKAG